ncbi:hypothetical protein C5C00_06205 [Rathayibacter rathayi]|uniref:glycosyltransferase family 1 protein n=1 Tax=Rathayibacter rathayi TaxID=33887 RepID=UPI000CE9300D|nr:glycosyltransferase family 1 protein [Rathayibacter rathayi]PPG89575.1 hypothetical protein C5C47_04645 [Rathayibacter rathayi]PPG97821.1 hypothetical protein C5C00_06205 [Rathayibacter rathayi]
MPEIIDTETFVIGDSTKTNSLGRALSMALTAAEFGRVRVLAFEDGELWAGAGQFPADVVPFGRRDLSRIERDVRAAASERRTIVWFSKGTDPLPRLARRLSRIPNTVVVADFDDDDVSIMEAFRSESLLNRAKANPLRRKAPSRLRRSQARIARDADLVTFSSAGLRGVYAERFELGDASAVIPHTRVSMPRDRPRAPSADGRLTLGFIGTVRSYKGADTLNALLRADTDVGIVTFAQSWTPPSDVAAQWTMRPPTTPLSEVYADVDVLVLPMDIRSPAALYQLPAKLVDAAVFGTPVAATPTPPIEEFAAGAFLPVTDWSDPVGVLAAIRAADKEQLGAALQARFTTLLSPEATADTLDTALKKALIRKSTHRA